MIWTRRGTTAAAITAKIGADHREAASKQWCDRHMRCVCGNPWSKRRAEPEPERRTNMFVSSVCTSKASKPWKCSVIPTGLIARMI